MVFALLFLAVPLALFAASLIMLNTLKDDNSKKSRRIITIVAIAVCLGRSIFVFLWNAVYIGKDMDDSLEDMVAAVLPYLLILAVVIFVSYCVIRRNMKKR